jgi:DNA-binding FadR family transcriptional regulator
MTAKERSQLLKRARYLDDLNRTYVTEVDDPAFLFSVQTYHMQFHLQIAKFSHSPKLIHAIEREQVLIFNWLYDTAAHRTALPAGFHLKLARAICGKNVQTADLEMRAHVRFGLNEVMTNLAVLDATGKGWRLKRVK